MSSVLQVAREGGVLRLTLNRPEKKNALNRELCEALVSAVEQSWTDPDVGSVLLESKGDSFCAGMDLTEAGTDTVEDLNRLHERLFTLGARASKPIVAAVGGPALGGGVGLVANAHIAVAAQGTGFGLTEIRVGMWPFTIWRAVSAAIGERRSTALALTGRIFSVNEALQWGLVQEVAPAFEVDDRATATAHHLAESSRQAIAAGFDFIRATRGQEPDRAGTLAAEFRTRAFASSDFREGLDAFREKRKPVWIR